MKEGTQMGDERVAELAGDAKAALAAYGAVARLGASRRAALRDRIAVSVAAGAPVAMDSAPARVDVAGSAWRIGVALAAAAGLLLAVRWMVTSGRDAQRSDDEAAAQAAYGAASDDRPSAATAAREPTAAPRPHEPDTARPIEPEDASAAGSVVEAPVTPARPPAPPQLERSPASRAAAPPQLERSPESPAPTPDTTLADEMKLMRSARAALREGDPARALRVLARHEADYADGQMVEDRDALHVQALCDAGRLEDARTEARAFARAYPGSPHAARVEKICTAP
jgi:hypothetical protein